MAHIKLVTIDSVRGNHLKGKKNNDVEGIIFQDVYLGLLPKNLDKFFSNIVGIAAINAKLKEITQNDLEHFTKLQIVMFINNLITSIDGDLFKKNPGMQEIIFAENPITNIDVDAFDGLKDSNELGLSDLKCKQNLGIAVNAEQERK